MTKAPKTDHQLRDDLRAIGEDVRNELVVIGERLIDMGASRAPVDPLAILALSVRLSVILFHATKHFSHDRPPR